MNIRNIIFLSLSTVNARKLKNIQIIGIQVYNKECLPFFSSLLLQVGWVGDEGVPFDLPEVAVSVLSSLLPSSIPRQIIF